MIKKFLEMPVVKELADSWYFTQSAGVAIGVALRIVKFVDLSKVFLLHSFVAIGSRLFLQVWDNKKKAILKTGIHIMNQNVPIPKLTRKVAFVAALVMSAAIPPVSLALASFSGLLTVLTRELSRGEVQNHFNPLAAKRST